MGSYQHMYHPAQQYGDQFQARGRQALGPAGGPVQPKIEKFDPEYGDDVLGKEYTLLSAI